MRARKYHFKQLIILEQKRRGRRYTKEATFGRVPDRNGGGGVGGASPRDTKHWTAEERVAVGPS